MPNGVDVLSKISGLSKEEVNNIWNDVKENQKKLNECPGPHDFQPENAEKKTSSNEICSICGGKTSKLNASWYKKGLKDGKNQDA